MRYTLEDSKQKTEPKMQCISNHELMNDFDSDMQSELEKIDRDLQALERLMNDDSTEADLLGFKNRLQQLADRLNILMPRQDDHYNYYLELSEFIKTFYDDIFSSLRALVVTL